MDSSDGIYTLDSLANNGVLGHHREVFADNDITVTSSGNENVGTRRGIFHGGNFVPSHRGLKRVDGIDLGNKNASTVRAERLGALEAIINSRPHSCEKTTYALSDVTEPSNDGDLTSKHDIGRALDTVDERLAAAIVVVKLGLELRIDHQFWPYRVI